MWRLAVYLLIVAAYLGFVVAISCSTMRASRDD